MIKQLPDPLVIEGITTFTQAEHIQQVGDTSDFRCTLPFPVNGWKQTIQSALLTSTDSSFNFEIDSKIPDNSSRSEGASRVKNIIAISSTKGGVGKSAIAINLAQTLSAMGAKTGLADCDIYGPSLISSLAGADIPPLKMYNRNDKKLVIPSKWQDIQLMSIAMSIESGQAVPWRGPMASNVALQILQQTHWGELDFLIVDLPPGTGDILLTIAKKLPPTLAITVTTPHHFSTEDTSRGIKLLETLKIPCAGVISNMQWFECPDCKSVHKIFSGSNLEVFAKDHSLDLIASLPIHPKLSGAWNEIFPNRKIPKQLNTLQTQFISIAAKVSLELEKIAKGKAEIQKITLHHIDPRKK